jgi:hypothetical protein
MLIVRILFIIGRYSHLIFSSEKCLDGEGHKKDTGSLVIILGMCRKVSYPSLLTHEIFSVTDYVLSFSLPTPTNIPKPQQLAPTISPSPASNSI